MKTEKKVGFAVVGLGAIAQGAVLLMRFGTQKRARLVALVGRDKGKAEKIGTEV